MACSVRQQGSHGAEFHQDIESWRFDYIVRKGTHRHVDSYSIFKENDGTQLGTDGLLKALGIEELDICGLALDYCLKYTVHDVPGRLQDKRNNKRNKRG
ncbi:isochorismatase family protein [Mesotoga sp.]|uniref:isochorismatase family protein n=1 Tax=Mesotoga sp. TaxID=2053577 RepID=UPI00345F0730